MSWKLRVEFRGVCVFFLGQGSKTVTTVVLPDGTRPKDKEVRPHHANLSVGGSPYPLKNQQLEFFYNGRALADDRLEPHEEGLIDYPVLSDVDGFPWERPKPGVKAMESLNPVCRARVQLVGGLLSTEAPTEHPWRFAEHPNTPGGGTARFFTTRVVWTRTIDRGDVQLHVYPPGKTGGNPEKVVMLAHPGDGNTVAIGLRNMEDPPTDDKPKPNVKNRWHDFLLTYELFEPASKRMVFEEKNPHPPVEPDEFRELNRSLRASAIGVEIRKTVQLPCIGGGGG